MREGSSSFQPSDKREKRSRYPPAEGFGHKQIPGREILQPSASAISEAGLFLLFFRARLLAVPRWACFGWLPLHLRLDAAGLNPPGHTPDHSSASWADHTRTHTHAHIHTYIHAHILLGYFGRVRRKKRTGNGPRYFVNKEGEKGECSAFEATGGRFFCFLARDLEFFCCVPTYLLVGIEMLRARVCEANGNCSWGGFEGVRDMSHRPRRARRVGLAPYLPLFNHPKGALL